MNALQQAWDSTAALYENFKLDASKVPPEKRRRYLNEEVLELIEASVIDGEFGTNSIALTEEAADVLVTVIGLLQGHGISRAEFEAAIVHVNAKNNMKTEANGYTYSGGKIRKTEAQR